MYIAKTVTNGFLCQFSLSINRSDILDYDNHLLIIAWYFRNAGVCMSVHRHSKCVSLGGKGSLRRGPNIKKERLFNQPPHFEV